jgi:DNA repair protein RecN (Recombination protein N)
MLRSLEIKNYALIQNLIVDWDKGLNIITGETGAGKSIVLGALGLIMGKRADSKVLFDAQNKCIVEAKFSIEKENYTQFFNDHDLELDDELVIRREISTAGKSRAFINDTPTTLDVVQELTDHLIDLHQQFDTLAMFKPKFQLQAIDALASNTGLVSEYEKAFLECKQEEKKLKELIALDSQSLKEKDFITFQFEELKNSNLVVGEQENLESSLEILSNAEDITRLSQKVSSILSNGDTNLADTLTSLAREYSGIIKISPSYNAVYERILGIVEELKDIASEAESQGESVESNPEVLMQANERLNLIYKLQKKHGLTSNDALVALEKELGLKLEAFDNNGALIESMTLKIEKSKKQLTEKAKIISQKRAQVIPKFEKEVNALLATLSMPNARLKVELIQNIELNINGSDSIQFLFATNKGSEFLPLKEVASGGELSRLTLCIKAILAEHMQLAVMIFDEIDTGVSGEVASKMGVILKKMAANHQMISITHSPQIAAKADTHYWVYKKDEDSRTISEMKILNETERIQEIAKMLSGDNPGKAAIDNAQELMKS